MIQINNLLQDTSNHLSSLNNPQANNILIPTQNDQNPQNPVDNSNTHIYNNNINIINIF